MRFGIVLITFTVLVSEKVGADNSINRVDDQVFASLPAQLFGKSGRPFIERGYENYVGFICKTHVSSTTDSAFCDGLFKSVTKDCRAQMYNAGCFRYLTNSPMPRGDTFLSFKAKSVKSVEDMLDDFGGCCEYVEVDQRVTTNACPSPVPWNLDRIDEGRTVDSVRDYYAASRGDKSIVFVIDTGIYSDHNEFKTATGNKVVGGYNVFTSMASALDGNGHGTHVSGTVAGQTFGVAKDTLLYGVKVLDDSGSGSISGVIAGISHTTSKCAPASSGDTAHQGVGWFAVPAANGGGYRRCVGSMSLGGGFVQSLNDAVRDAVRTWNVPIVVAAGNDNADAGSTSPASAPDAITVGASDASDLRASFSNYGKMVDIYAPGVSVLSSYIGSPTATATMSGTSMATPHVSGAVALLLSTDTTLTATSVVRVLFQTGLGSWIAGPDGCRNALLQVRRASTDTCDGDTAAAALDGNASWMPSPCGSIAGVFASCSSGPSCTNATPRAGGCDCITSFECSSGVCDASTAKCTAAQGSSPTSTPQSTSCSTASPCSRGDTVCDASCCRAYGSTYYSSSRRGVFCICKKCAVSPAAAAAAAQAAELRPITAIGNLTAPMSSPAPGETSSGDRAQAAAGLEWKSIPAVSVGVASDAGNSGSIGSASTSSQDALNVGLGIGAAMLGSAGVIAVLISFSRSAAASATRKAVVSGGSEGIVKSAELVFPIDSDVEAQNTNSAMSDAGSAEITGAA